jgi:hypothetical protein
MRGSVFPFCSAMIFVESRYLNPNRNTRKNTSTQQRTFYIVMLKAPIFALRHGDAMTTMMMAVIIVDHGDVHLQSMPPYHTTTLLSFE